MNNESDCQFLLIYIWNITLVKALSILYGVTIGMIIGEGGLCLGAKAICIRLC